MADAAGAKPAPVLRNRNYLLLFSGKIVSQLGDQLYAFALSWYILDRTKSPIQMAIFLVVDSLTLALLSPLGGAIADRTSRKSILVAMDLVRWTAVLALALVLYAGALEIWMLYVGAVALAACGAVFNPAAGAIIPNLVEADQIPEASSMNQFSWSLCAFAGMLLGGGLYAWAGIKAVFIINAASFLISAGFECFVSARAAPAGERPLESILVEIERAVRELREGYLYVRKDRLITAFCIMYAAYNALLMPIGFVYFPYLFNVILKATSFQLALSLGSLFAGTMVASIIIPRVLHKLDLRKAIIRGLLLLCACQVFAIAAIFTPLGAPFRASFGNWGITYLCTFISFLLGFAMTFFNVPITIILQKRAIDEFRGRFWGFFGSLSSLSVPIGYLAGAALVRALPLWFAYALSTIGFIILCFWLASLRELRGIKI
jgi:MFS family permease